MMETPTISKKQQNKILSRKKNKKETIKNVVASPLAPYWPLLRPEDQTTLTDILERCLPRLRGEKVSVPYSVIKSVPKEERRTFRQIFTNEKPPSINKVDIDSLIFGVNDVAKLLENRQAASILVAADISPRLFIQHVIDQTVMYDVAVLVMPDLRKILREKCGISSSSVAIKNDVRPGSSNLSLINEAICHLHLKYPVPNNHMNYHRRTQTTTNATDDCVKYKELKVKRLTRNKTRKMKHFLDKNSKL